MLSYCTETMAQAPLNDGNLPFYPVNAGTKTCHTHFWRNTMLILARYPQEAILIGEARVTVLEIIQRRHGRSRVTLGIEAPAAISILRAELSHVEAVMKNEAPADDSEEATA